MWRGSPPPHPPHPRGVPCEKPGDGYPDPARCLLRRNRADAETRPGPTPPPAAVAVALTASPAQLPEAPLPARDRPSAKSGARTGKGPGPRSRGAGRKGAGKCCRPEGLPAAAWPRARLPAALPPWTPHSSTARLQRCDPHSQGPGCHRADGEPGRHVGCRRQSLQTPVACG